MPLSFHYYGYAISVVACTKVLSAANCNSLYYSRLRWGYYTLYCVHLYTVPDQPSHDHRRDIIWSRKCSLVIIVLFKLVHILFVGWRFGYYIPPKNTKRCNTKQAASVIVNCVLVSICIQAGVAAAYEDVKIFSAHRSRPASPGRVIFFLSMLRAWAVLNCLIWWVMVND